MRTLALAQAWQDNGKEVTFILGSIPRGIEDRLRRDGMQIRYVGSEPGSMEEAEETTGIIDSIGPSWVVLDGYHFRSEYQRRIKKAGPRLLFIDDYGHAPPYTADIILNQNLSAKPTLYEERDDNTKLLLGTQYVLLRREFREWSGFSRRKPEVPRKVLVTFGGSDPENITGYVMDALNRSGFEEIDLTVVAGFSNPHGKALELAGRSSRIPVRIIRGSLDMPLLMAEAHMAISGGGSTSWELICMGVPTIVIQLAENQRSLVTALGRQGAVIDLGAVGDLPKQAISATLKNLIGHYQEYYDRAQRGRSMVDGMGAVRVTAIMQGISGKGS